MEGTRGREGKRGREGGGGTEEQSSCILGNHSYYFLSQLQRELEAREEDEDSGVLVAASSHLLQQHT